MRVRLLCLLALVFVARSAAATPVFVNGLALDGGATDTTGTTSASRVGYFSDLYYASGYWWGLSDRGPGGGLLNYDTRVQKFTLDVDLNSGAISNFQIVDTIVFSDGAGGTFNGLAPSPSDTLGNSFDPEGFVISPVDGHMFVADEYGPSVYEFDQNGVLVKKFTVPANLVPKTASGVDYNETAPNSTTPAPFLVDGRENNRGYEGLAISPDGQYAYAVLQDGTIDDGSSGATSFTRSFYTRIVKYDVATGMAVAQYAYKLDRNGQGEGVSALVALGNDEFLILERNNRGIGVGAELTTADKNVYRIDLKGASDVTSINLPFTNSPLPAGYTPVAKSSKLLGLEDNTLAALGNKSPEKWEGLAIGPQLNDGSYLLLAGTDNDYSVTQSGAGTQYDVYFDFTASNPYQASIQCPIGTTANCFLTSNEATSASLTSAYSLLPGVLHAYKAPAADVLPTPEPTTCVLLLSGLGAMAARRRALRRRSA